MDHKRYTIGLDFGTLSARAALVDVLDGHIEAVSEFGYPDTVIEERLPGTEIRLPSDFALQNPENYIDAVICLLRDVWRKAKIDPGAVIGIGVGFTASTVVAVDEAYTPLCMKPEYRDNPHSWVKLWKHHGACAEAEFMNRLEEKRQDEFFRKCGGKINAELMLPKIFETYRKAPEIYGAAYKFLEASDWMTWVLCGQEIRNSSSAGLKIFWNRKSGYPKDFFRELDEGFAGVIEKLDAPIENIGCCAGYLTERMANETGLHTNVAVGVSSSDAVLSFPALSVLEEGCAVLTLGTSACYQTTNREEVCIPGILAVVEDAMLPGLYGYDAGMTAVGDLFDWFANRIEPYHSRQRAAEENLSVFDVLSEKAALISPGQSGLVALDWWNGNRSMLGSSELSGMVVGFTLNTKPEEIYRALIEAAAYGMRMIHETFEENGIVAEEIVACGGLARKSSIVMQIFSDVLGREIKAYDAPQAIALGAAIYGAVAAGTENGGYEDVFAAGRRMGQKEYRSYYPDKGAHVVYDQLFEIYKKLHQRFGVEETELMQRLKIIRKENEPARHGEERLMV